MRRVGALLVALIAVSAAPAAAPAAAPVTVRVTASKAGVTLSRKQVPVGALRVVFVNRADGPRALAIGGRRTPVVARGRSATLAVRFSQPGAKPYRVIVPGRPARHRRGSLRVVRPQPAEPSLQRLQLTPLGQFARPVAVASPPADPRRVFVVEQTGKVRLLLDGVPLEESFLDLSQLVCLSNEAGLLGLAFAPDYAASGRVYATFTGVGCASLNLVEFRRSAWNPDVADPSTYRPVLAVPQPAENHNGGTIQFGPDGLLYLSVGDGDGGVVHAPGAFAQSLDNHLGGILRIDPRETGERGYSVPTANPFVGREGILPEIYAYGLRNPWRFWVDLDGGIYVGDVGQSDREEIDYIPPGRAGLNFGWPCHEGTKPFDLTTACPGAVAPILEYSHDNGRCSVTAGLVVRDARLPSLTGRFLYGDFCSGELRSFRLAGRMAADDRPHEPTARLLTGFGVDAESRIYVTSLAGGVVYRLDPAG